MNQSLSLAVIEHDIHGDALVVWTYPGSTMHDKYTFNNYHTSSHHFYMTANIGMPSVMQSLCAKRSTVEGMSSPFIYFKVKNEW